MKDLNNTVISNGYCVGCGACSGYKKDSYHIDFDNKGQYIAEQIKHEDDALNVCPFSDSCKDENQLGKLLFKGTPTIKHNVFTGYFLKNYAGYVKTAKYRENGSSGGMVTWLAAELLNRDLVDKIIHVKPDEDNEGVLFSYQISDTVEGLKKGSKSKYYPVNISRVIEYVKDNPGRYAFVGIPCFVKAVRLLSIEQPIIGERITFTIGLVCGHLKSDRFAKSMAWEMGIKPSQLVDFDFRVEIKDKKAFHYGVEATEIINGKKEVKFSPVKELFASNWGHGLFKYQACDYCDDVLAETADITVGDAWLPEYVNDSQGTNIIIIRNPEILKIIENNDNLHLEHLSVDKVYQSQAGGFRHRRAGLRYRLYLKDQANEWRPKKRLKAGNGISKKRQAVYKMRMKLYEESFTAYDKALAADDFNILKQHLNPIISEYSKISKMSLFARVILRLKRIVNRIFTTQ